MSADKCPVCGCAEKKGESLDCTDWMAGEVCFNAERLAIERAAEIERLKASTARLWDALNSLVSHVVACDNPVDCGASSDDQEILDALKALESKP